MANNATEVDPEKMEAEIDKVTKQLQTLSADADEILNDIKANAGLKDKLEKALKKT
jgi:ElaB/YqjD/DUF883 family membrane-anchored ribosome-binding protein